MELVRAGDRDRYLSVLYAPEDKRADLLALYAFNAEIAGIRNRVTQPLMGEVRLQWWRDVIETGDAGAGAGHPVAEQLVETIKRHSLPRQAFLNHLDARIFDLYDDPMPTRSDLEGYCGETASATIQLASIVLSPEAAARTGDIAGHAGCAQAITGLLRLLPLQRRRGQCYFPKDMLAAAGTTPEEFLAGDGGENAPRAVAAMMALASEHLSAFERGAGALAPALAPGFLPLALTHAQLTRMRGRERELLSAPVDIGAWRKHWLMFRRAAGGWK